MVYAGGYTRGSSVLRACDAVHETRTRVARERAREGSGRETQRERERIRGKVWWRRSCIDVRARSPPPAYTPPVSCERVARRRLSPVPGLPRHRQDCRHLQLPPPLFRLRLLARSATSFTPPRFSSATLRIINRPCKFPRPLYSPVEEPRAVRAPRPTRDSSGCVRHRDEKGEGRREEAGALE